MKDHIELMEEDNIQWWMQLCALYDCLSCTLHTPDKAKHLSAPPSRELSGFQLQNAKKQARKPRATLVWNYDSLTDSLTYSLTDEGKV